MTINPIRYTNVAALALSLAACSGGGPNAATAISVAVDSPRAATGGRPPGAGPAKSTGSSGAEAGGFVAGTLCARPDQVVFSCPLEKTGKIVSICAAGDAAPHRFYYAFGKAGDPQLVYPTKAVGSVQALNRTYLTFAGGTGGYAFSFHKQGFEYIVFSVSGKGFANSGVIVRHIGARRAAMHLECDAGKTMESNDDAILNETLKLEEAEDLKNGLPIYPPEDRP